MSFGRTCHAASSNGTAWHDHRSADAGKETEGATSCPPYVLSKHPLAPLQWGEGSSYPPECEYVTDSAWRGPYSYAMAIVFAED